MRQRESSNWVWEEGCWWKGANLKDQSACTLIIPQANRKRFLRIQQEVESGLSKV